MHHSSKHSLVVASFAALAVAACGDISITFGDGESKVKGSGVKASESRSVAAFTAIEARGVGKLNLRVGESESESVKISADDNIVPLIKSEVKDGVLILSTKGASNSKTDIVFDVTAKAINRLENSGTVSIDASGFSGGALSVEASGVGSITLAGRVDSLKVELSGVGRLEADELIADRVSTSLSGVGSANVRAEKSINGNVSGVGSLTWKGAATDVSTNVSGIGRVSKG